MHELGKTDFDQPWPQSYDCIVLDEVDSTMDEARRRLPELTRPTWIFARNQSAPRGRRGRVWHMPEGNFSATLVMRPDEPIAHAALRAFTAGLAMLSALSPYSAVGEFALKWPNDVLLYKRKIAGILLESESLKDKCQWLSIGFGANLRGAPASSDLEPQAIPATSLRQDGHTVPRPEDVLHRLACSFADWERIFRDYGFESVGKMWIGYAYGLDQPVVARMGKREVRGIFRTIDLDGNLILKMDDGSFERIAAADLFF